MENIDPKWHATQVKKYVEEMPHYVEYAKTLSEVLTAVANRYAPEAIVQSRPKSLPSFAEKAARKRHKYDNPTFQITDLCGARIIVHTRGNLEAVCRFIRENFVVDEANSDDAAARLGTAEFGYRSVHFVVQVRKPQILGIKVPLTKIGERKAEIQVRTFLQHAWATVTHDRLYKAGFEPPPALKRMASRLAALLEDSEEVIKDFENGMEQYLGHYSTYLDKESRQREMQIQLLVFDSEKEAAKKIPVALKLAQLARDAGDAAHLRQAIKVLQSVEDFVPEPLLVAFNLELGMVLLQISRATHSPQDIKKAYTYLRKAAQEQGGDCASGDCMQEKLRAEAAHVLAVALKESADCRSFSNLAIKCDPRNPYHLLSAFENDPILTPERQVPESLRPALLGAIETCCKHLAAGIEIPRAWFAIARLSFLLDKPYQALDYYAKGIWFYLKNKGAKGEQPWKEEAYKEELLFLDKMAQAGFCHQVGSRGLCGPLGWMSGLLKIGWAVKQDQAKKFADGDKLRLLYKYPADKRVVIISGAALLPAVSEGARYEKLLEAALEGFDGIVICGGTIDGIPGIVGSVAKTLRARQKASFTLISYHPRTMPAQIMLDKENYDKFFVSDGENDFSAAEPLQNWIDLIASGIDPRQVRVLGINGGDISRFEYALALSLGATVGVVESSGRGASGICLDTDWGKSRSLLPLPADPMTLRAFLRPAFPCGFSKEELELMGRKVHEFYLPPPEKRSHKNPSSLPWEYVPEDFRNSSRQQAAFAAGILNNLGYTICERLSRGAAATKFLPEEIELMAEMEHGRWNVERLETGWRYAPKKDTDKQRSPFLKSWKDLPEEIKEYDRNAVKFFPEVFKAVGYHIVKAKGAKA